MRRFWRQFAGVPFHRGFGIFRDPLFYTLDIVDKLGLKRFFQIADIRQTLIAVEINRNPEAGKAG